MKKFLSLFVCLLLFPLTVSATGKSATVDRDVLYQPTRIDYLLSGHYDGKVTYKEVRKHGDFGLGTFDHLDGEMVELDGTLYQVKSDGSINPVADSAKSPFAAVTFFDAKKKASTDQPLDLQQLSNFLDGVILDKETYYAIRIDGTFKYVKTRSVPAQKKPYPPLSEVAKTQPTFEFHDVKGTLVGFRCPESANGINLPGYHFHFITEDRKGGGHLLEVQTDSIAVGIDETPRNSLTAQKKPAKAPKKAVK